jgi:hypothetical protein
MLNIGRLNCFLNWDAYKSAAEGKKVNFPFISDADKPIDLYLKHKK